MPSELTQHRAHLPIVALIGRVNVGKSMLFNRLIEQNKAIVSGTPGTTRTSNEGHILWRGKEILLIDTGGLTFEDEELFEKEILRQSERDMKRADVILFVTDAKTGVLPQERELAKRLRRLSDKHVILVANKTDSAAIARNLTEKEWYMLGLGEPFPISAKNGRNTGELLDRIYSLLKKVKPKTVSEKKEIIDIGIIGKPNVGKSSLFNKLIGEEKVIVSEIAHTTREPHDTLMEYTEEIDEKKIVHYLNVIDTAGIRRKAQVGRGLEHEGVARSIRVAESADIALLVLDANEPISSQDKQLGGFFEKHARSVIILLNKWDLSEEKTDAFRNQVKAHIEAHFPHLSFAPILFVSGKTGHNVHTILPAITHAWRTRQTTIGVKALETFLKHATGTHAPSRGKGTRHPKLMGIRQLATAPPVFEIMVKYRTSIHASYIKFLKNQMRIFFDFYGSPIIIKLRKMKK